jgi:hypothetical protein
MADKEKRVTVSVEELTLSNSLQLTALVELLEEKGILTQAHVIERAEAIRDRRQPGKGGQQMKGTASLTCSHLL